MQPVQGHAVTVRNCFKFVFSFICAGFSLCFLMCWGHEFWGSFIPLLRFRSSRAAQASFSLEEQVAPSRVLTLGAQRAIMWCWSRYWEWKVSLAHPAQKRGLLWENVSKRDVSARFLGKAVPLCLGSLVGCRGWSQTSPCCLKHPGFFHFSAGRSCHYTGSTALSSLHPLVYVFSWENWSEQKGRGCIAMIFDTWMAWSDSGHEVGCDAHS